MHTGTTTRPLDDHRAEFKRDGMTVFRGHLSPATVAAARHELEPVFAAAFARDARVPKLKLGAAAVTGVAAGGDWPGGGLLDHPLWASGLEPLLHRPWHNDRLFDFCELVMGPQVQLDSFGVSAFPGCTEPAPAGGWPWCEDPSSEAAAVPRPPTFSWHRDNFALGQYYAGVGEYNFPQQHEGRYRPPLGMNLLCYLQDMNRASGPLRVVPASHLGAPATPAEDAALLPHPQERLLDLRAGDLVRTKALSFCCASTAFL
eukprot:SAG22_NODE_115_length_19315_cov_10.458368_2_plen_259_part_00